MATDFTIDDHRFQQTSWSAAIRTGALTGTPEPEGDGTRWCVDVEKDAVAGNASLLA